MDTSKYNHILTHLTSEIDGANGYLDMAEAAEKMDEDGLAKYLYEMAKDEYSHAKFIKYFLEKKHVSIAQDTYTKYDELCTRMKSTFR